MPFMFVGNALWLDFLNTEPCVGGLKTELLFSSEALALWGEAAGVPPPPVVPPKDRAWLSGALELRRLLRNAAVRLVSGQDLPAALVQSVNRYLREKPFVRVLQPSAAGWALASQPANPTSEAFTAFIALDFARFIAAGRTDRVRQCAHPDCVMVFLDTSKNGSRRWCSMETCGNREKARLWRVRG